MGGAVVAGKDHQGMIATLVLIEFGEEDLTHVAVEIMDHGGVGGAGSWDGGCRRFGRDRLRSSQSAGNCSTRITSGVHGDVGFDEGEVEEKRVGERGVSMKLLGFGDHEVGGVGLADPVLQCGSRLWVDGRDRGWVGH
jgi:hypothetical protein